MTTLRLSFFYGNPSVAAPTRARSPLGLSTVADGFDFEAPCATNTPSSLSNSNPAAAGRPFSTSSLYVFIVHTGSAHLHFNHLGHTCHWANAQCSPSCGRIAKRCKMTNKIRIITVVSSPGKVFQLAKFLEYGITCRLEPGRRLSRCRLICGPANA